MKRLAAIALTVLFVATLTGFAPAAAAQPGEQSEPSRLHLDVDQMNPRLVTTTSSTLGISGRITNTGDRRITNIKVQLQLGERQTSEKQLKQALAESPETGSSVSQFVDVVASLEPGQSAPLTVNASLRGDSGLEIAKQGVYPLLVNVNGTPDFGGRTRLAAVSLLLPVVSVPGKPAPPNPAKATPFTLLWPLADTRPNIVSAPLGESVVLGDDHLADDLAPTGRLGALLTGARRAKQNPKVFNALCFGIDPDLIGTVTAMTRGYQVRTPWGSNVPGRGKDAAVSWLESVRGLVGGHCTVAMPSSDADLSQLTKLGDSGKNLAKAAVDDGRLRTLLDADPADGVLWPGGSLDTGTLGTIAEAGVHTVLADTQYLESTKLVSGGVGLEGSSVRAQSYDTLLAKAFAGTSGRPDSSTGVTTPADDPDVGTQNGLAVLAYRSTATADAGKPLLVAPPRRWAVPDREFDRLFDSIDELVTRNMLTGMPLQQQLGAGESGVARMTYTPAEGALPGNLADIDSAATDVRSVMEPDTSNKVNPDLLVKPVHDAVIRATSTAWQFVPGGADQAASTARDQLDDLRGRIAVIPPGQPFSFASGSSPIPVAMQNKLPVAVTVRLRFSDNAGLRIDPVPDQPIPRNSIVPVRVPAEALRAGRFSLDVSLTTSSGTQLGPTARFELTSSEYGIVTVIVTSTAGVALLLLSGRRIYRRVKERKAA
ncbi:DUF6049 family protein [Amycolatopsis sp. CA-230715]|uniref:DUF6049 family protein n=1 Tax=Amycolatopsis sp. CA-230715 TaxID=2745196 RepID=UPI001C0126CD|nr:DUF6049 family protein [Amycolatopsis sp. CA-230715]QWF80493.1 hypothetical protein HUW46_03916 [Amycolatopsis sp. CA-230715]